MSVKRYLRHVDSEGTVIAGMVLASDFDAKEREIERLRERLEESEGARDVLLRQHNFLFDDRERIKARLEAATEALEKIAALLEAAELAFDPGVFRLQADEIAIWRIASEAINAARGTT